MIKIKEANVNDVSIILDFIKDLAEYENMSHLVSANEDLLRKNIFENKYSKVLLAYYDNKIAAMALYFYNFSTFLAKGGIYLEDLFVKKEFRNKKIASHLFRRLAQIAVENDLARIDFVCLKDNDLALNYYDRIGAKIQDEWHLLRLNSDDILKLSKKEF